MKLTTEQIEWNKLQEKQFQEWKKVVERYSKIKGRENGRNK
jgi:hypothetical protein